MEPFFRTVTAKKLVGKHVTTSLTQNKTFELWSSFMPRRKEIENVVGSELYSVQVFNPEYFNGFNPNTEFEKWAAVEVSDHNHIPEGMDALVIPAGLYAVFIHKGPASDGPKTFQYIFNTWLPASDYVVDDRPHFEVMGEKYKNNHPDSEEELWVPVKLK